MIVWPCAGPMRSACKIRRSSVPWRSSIRSRLPIDILGELSIDATPRMSRWKSNDQFGAAIGRTVDDVGGNPAAAYSGAYAAPLKLNHRQIRDASKMAWIGR